MFNDGPTHHTRLHICFLFLLFSSHGVMPAIFFNALSVTLKLERPDSDQIPTSWQPVEYVVDEFLKVS